MGPLMWKVERIRIRIWKILKNKLLKVSVGHVLYYFLPHDNFTYRKSFDGKLRFPPLQANCNPNAISVQCMQLANPTLGAIILRI